MFFKASPKRMIEKYLRIVSSARKKAASAEDMQTIGSRINGKLAQRLDSAGFHDVAEHIVLGREGSSTDVTPEGNVETAKKAGLLSMLIEGYRSRPLSRRLMLLGGGAVVGGAGFLAVLAVMVWYRGGTLVRIGEQGVAPSILSLEKKIETEYGVGVSSNSFTIVAQNGAVFRAQGIEHRITLVPPIELDVVLSPDGKRVTVTPAEDLVPETEYRLSLIEGTSFSDGTALPDDFTWAFRTEPVFAVTGITPRDGSCCAPVDTAIEIEFNYKNVDPEVLSDYFTIEPPVVGRFEHQGSNIVFLPSRPFSANSVYHVTVAQGLPNGRGDVLQNPSSATFQIGTGTSAGQYLNPPQMFWSDPSPVIAVTQEPWIGVSHYNTTGNFSVSLYSAEIDAVLPVAADEWNVYVPPDPDHVTKLRDWTLTPEDAVFFNVDVNGYGIYLLEVFNESYGQSIYKYLIYSPVGISLSHTNNSDLVWLFDMVNKAPVPGATVTFHDFDGGLDGEGEEFTVTTDTNGYAAVDHSGTDVIVAQSNGNLALVAPDPDHAQTWWGGYASYEHNTDYRAFVYTDRPLYRPGDTVHYKVVARAEDDMEYTVPANMHLTMRLGDGSGYTWQGLRALPLFEESVILSAEFGTAVSEFVLPSNTIPGYHDLTAYLGEAVVGSGTVAVAEYEKPRYTFEMSVDRTRAFTGDTVLVEITGRDYSGDPAAGVSVGLAVNKGDMTGLNWIEGVDELDRMQSRYYGSESVADAKVTLDLSGHGTYEFTIDAGDFDTTLGVYTIYIWSQENYLTHDGETVIVAHKPETLFAQPEDWSVGEGEDTQLTFKSAGLWDMEPAPGTRVVFDVLRKWTTWVEDGTYYDPVTKSAQPQYRAVSQTEVVMDDAEVTTDSDGLADIDLTNLGHGSYTVTAQYFPDETAGVSRTFSNILSVYEVPEEPGLFPGWDYATQKFQLYTDKQSYDIGDEAVITIQTTLTGKGLYWVSRGDVYAWRIADFSTGMVTVREEITDQMDPYVQICAAGIDSYSSSANYNGTTTDEYLSNIFRSSCVQVPVQGGESRLDVMVTANAQEYEPGDEVTADIVVKDGQGRGVHAEVSVDVVDRALLDIVRENNELDSDIYDAFYANVRQYTINKTSPFEYWYAGFSGGGAGGGGEGPVRSNFADAAFWDGRVITDSSGRARVTFVLPDNLTTWTLRATAVTEDTLVGQGSADIVSRKDVRLSAHIPSFIRSGDEWEMSVEAYNYSGSQVTARVSVSCPTCVDTSFSSDVRLTAGSRQVVTFPVVAREGADSVSLTAELSAGQMTYDAVLWRIPVVSAGFVQDDTYAALLSEGDETVDIPVVIPSGTDLSRADMHVTVSRSFINQWALMPLDPSVSSTVDLAGSILHNSVLLEHYDEISPLGERGQFEQKITSALDLLGDNQDADGGFSWFEYDAVSYEVSAYAALALGRAADAGIQVGSGLTTNIQTYLWQGLASENVGIDDKILGVYALSVLGDSTVLPYALALKEQSGEFADSPVDIAHLMLALQELGSMGDASMLIPLLESSARRTQRTATWQDHDTEFRIVRTVEYTTAVVYQALAPYGPRELTDMARTWLVENPMGASGVSVDAVAVFCALTEASLDGLAERNDSNEVTVFVNGRAVRSFEVEGGKGQGGTVDLLIDPVYLTDGTNVVTIQRHGGGLLYAVVDVQYYSEENDVEPEFTVTREIRDFDTGEPVVSVQKGDVVTVRVTVVPDRDGYDLVVKDFVPSGFEPVQYQLGSYDYDFYRKWWQWGRDWYVNRYGSVAQDHVSFVEYSVDRGKPYVFEYPMVAAFSGSFSSGGAEAFLAGFGDIGGRVQSGIVRVVE